MGEAGAFGPVGPVDAVLDLGLAEPLVGEAVEGDYFEAAPVEVAAEGAQGGGVGDEGGGRVAGEPQADAEPVAAQALADGLAVVAELGADAVEGLGGVDVGAVGEVDGGAVGVAEAHRLTPPPCGARPAGCCCPRARRGRWGRARSGRRGGR